jgi:hypothetical protein
MRKRSVGEAIRNSYEVRYLLRKSGEDRNQLELLARRPISITHQAKSKPATRNETARLARQPYL